jgi:hypothetical protein
MEIEKLGRMEPFNDLQFGELFYGGQLGMRVSFGQDRGVLLVDGEPKATIVDGSAFANKRVLVLDKPTFQVARDLAHWKFGLPKSPANGIVIVSKDDLRLRATQASGDFDIDLATGNGRRSEADENVAWTSAWRIVVKAGMEREAMLLQSVEWTSNT